MTQTQKKFLLIGLLALLPAYFFSNWRHVAKGKGRDHNSLKDC